MSTELETFDTKVKANGTVRPQRGWKNPNGELGTSTRPTVPDHRIWSVYLLQLQALDTIIRT